MQRRSAHRAITPFFERNTFGHPDVALEFAEQLPHLYDLFRGEAVRIDGESHAAKSGLWRTLVHRLTLHNAWCNSETTFNVHTRPHARLLYEALVRAERARASHAVELVTPRYVMTPAQVLQMWHPASRSNNPREMHSSRGWIVEAVRTLVENARGEEDIDAAIVAKLAEVLEHVTGESRAACVDVSTAAEDVLVAFAQSIDVRLPQRPHHGTADRNTRQTDEGQCELDEATLYASKEPPNASEAKLAGVMPIAALRGFLANVHPHGSQVERKMSMDGDDASIEDELKDVFSVDEKARSDVLRDFSRTTSVRQPISTCVSCGARGVDDDVIHRIAENIEAAQYTEQDHAVYDAASAYRIKFPMMSVELTLADLITVFVADDGRKFKLNPHVVNASRVAWRDRCHVRAGDHSCHICGTCARVADEIQKGKLKDWHSIGLIQGDDFGDLQSFWEKFVAVCGDDALTHRQFIPTVMELKVLGLARMCAHTFKVNAGFNAQRMSFTGHTICFVNRNRDVLDQIRLLTMDELEESARISIVGCKRNGEAAIRRLRSEWTGALEVRELTLYVWYELIRQLRCRTVVEARLTEMDDAEQSSILRSTIFQTIFPLEPCSNASLFDSYAAEIPYSDWTAKARTVTEMLLKRAQDDIDDSDLAERVETYITEETADVAAVRSGDNTMFENASFIYDTNLDSNPSMVDMLAELRRDRFISRGDNPCSEWQQSNRMTLFECQYPHVTVIPGSGKKIEPTTPRNVRTCIMYMDKRFTRDRLLVWHLYDSARRIEVWKGASMSVTSEKAREVQEILDNPSFDEDLQRALYAETRGRRIPANIARLLSLLDVQRYVKMSFTDELRRTTRARLLDLERFYGPPILFFTIAPDDKSSALMLRLGAEPGKRVDLFPETDRIAHDNGEHSSFVNECAKHDLKHSFLEKTFAIASSNDLMRFAADNPVATALVFERLVTAFVKDVLGIDYRRSRSTQQRALAKTGLFGKASSAAYVVETNGRECLHVHGLLYGTDITPGLLRRVAAQEHNVDIARNWMDKTFVHEIRPSFAVISAVMKKLHVPINALKSIALAAAEIQQWRTSDDAESFGEFVASMVNVHNHSESCFKGGRTRCRFGMPCFHDSQPTRAVTIKQEQVMETCFQCEHIRSAYAPNGTGLNLYPDNAVSQPNATWGRPLEIFKAPSELLDDEEDSQIWVKRCRYTHDTFSEEMMISPSVDRLKHLENLNSFDALILYLRHVDKAWSENPKIYSAVRSVVPLDAIIDTCERALSTMNKEDEVQWFKELQNDLRCKNALVAPYNALVTAVAPHNTSLNFMSSPTDCKIASFYLSKYISKDQTVNLQPLETLRHIRRQRHQRTSTAPDAGEATRQYKFNASRLANVAMAHRQIPDTVVTAWGMHLDSDYFSDSFVYVHAMANVQRACDLVNAYVNTELYPLVSDSDNDEEYASSAGEEENFDVFNDAANNHADERDYVAELFEADLQHSAQTHSINGDASRDARIDYSDELFSEPGGNAPRDDDEHDTRYSDQDIYSDQDAHINTSDEDDDSDSDYVYNSETESESASPARAAQKRFHRLVQRTPSVPRQSTIDPDDVHTTRLRLNARGVMSDLIDLICDYLHRHESFKLFSLIEYACCVQKRKVAFKRSPEHCELADNDRGRQSQKRYLFKGEHPQAQTHAQVLRVKIAVPAWVGKGAIPSVKAKGKERRLAMFTLVHFKPWASVEELHELLSDPCESYKEFVHSLQVSNASFVEQGRHMLIKNVLTAQHISSAQRVLFTEFRSMCADKAEDVKTRTGFDTSLMPGHREENDTNEVRVDEQAIELLLTMQAEPQVHKYNVGLDRIKLLVPKHPPSMQTRSNTMDTENIEKHIRSDIQHLDDGTANMINRLIRAVESCDPQPSVNESDHQTLALTQSARIASLSQDQKMAFDHVIAYLSNPTRESCDAHEQCLLVLGGPGTGKTFFIDVLRKEIEGRGFGSTLVVAPSAAAATLHYRGATIHGAFSLTSRESSAKQSSQRRRPMQPDAAVQKLLKILSRDNAPLATLIIDEISMVQTDWLIRINETLKRLNKSSSLFGGVGVVCAGDYKQLPPVLGKCIAACLQDDPILDSTQGAILLTQMTMIELTTQVRSVDDAAHTLRIERCRAPINPQRSSLDDFFQTLEPERCVSVEDTVVVLTNASRRAFNFELALAQAMRDDSYVLIWNERINSKCALTEEQLQHIYAHENAVGGHLMGIFVPNMRAVLDRNVSIALHAVNSSRGVMKRVIYLDSAVHDRITRAIQRALASRDETGARNQYIVHCGTDAPDGIAMKLDNPSKEWPQQLSLDSDGDITLPIMATTVEKTIAFKSNTVKAMGLTSARLHKCEVSPAYAFTAHKSQGQTMTNNVRLWLPPEDVRSANGRAEALYVVLSRVRTSAQLKYLPHDSIAEIQPYFVRWEHALGLEFNQTMDAFLHSYVEIPDAPGKFQFNRERFDELQQQAPISISKNVRYNKALSEASQDEQRNAPKRRRTVLGARASRIG